MTTTPNLAITEVASSQNQKELTINNALAQLDNATQRPKAITFTSNAKTLNATDFTNNVCFTCGTLTAAGTLTVPLSKRVFYVDNTGNATYGVAVGGATGAAITVPAGALAEIHCDGTDCKTVTALVLGTGLSSFQGRSTAAAVLTVADVLGLDFSAAPTADPGSGKLWLNGGVLQVGP